MENKKEIQKCQAKDPETHESICNRDIWDDKEKLCIFHCKEKPADEFKKFFLVELKHVNETASIKEFNGRYFIFLPTISLKGISFNKPANFAFAKFYDETDFSNAKFVDETKFYYAEFGDKTNFKGAKFGDKTNFGYAEFGDKTTFAISKFGNKTDFVLAKFSNKTTFGSAKFGNETDFRDAKFGDETSFLDAEFGDKTDFGDAKFGNETSFGRSIFGDETSFFNAEFGDVTKFHYAEFGNKTDFEDAKFGYQLHFISIRFNGETLLKNIKFKETNSDRIINFTNVNFEEPIKVRIENVDLSSFAFAKSNIQNINFLNCSWLKVGKRLAVFDEINYFKKNGYKDRYLYEKATLGEIEQLYLRLQYNFENNKRYAEAGDYYIGAMEMRRKQIAQDKNKVWRWIRQNVFSLMALYRYVSLYGERYSRTLIWMLIVLLMFPAFYLIAGFEYPVTNLHKNKYEYINYDIVHNLNISEFTKDYFREAIIVSLYAFTFQRNMPYHFTKLSHILSIVETALSAILLSLFLLALRRRFRR